MESFSRRISIILGEAAVSPLSFFGWVPLLLREYWKGAIASVLGNAMQRDDGIDSYLCCFPSPFEGQLSRQIDVMTSSIIPDPALPWSDVVRTAGRRADPHLRSDLQCRPLRDTQRGRDF
jgi:hypothetical protein